MSQFCPIFINLPLGPLPTSRPFLLCVLEHGRLLCLNGLAGLAGAGMAGMATRNLKVNTPWITMVMVCWCNRPVMVGWFLMVFARRKKTTVVEDRLDWHINWKFTTHYMGCISKWSFCVCRASESPCGLTDVESLTARRTFRHGETVVQSRFQRVAL